MLNYFKYYKRCIHISFHILDFIQQETRFTILEQPYILPILFCQCHSCWCLGDWRSQGISRRVLIFKVVSSTIRVNVLRLLHFVVMYHHSSLSACGRLSQLSEATTQNISKSTWLADILHCCFTGTGTIMRLPQHQWSNHVGYGQNLTLPNYNASQ